MPEHARTVTSGTVTSGTVASGTVASGTVASRTVAYGPPATAALREEIQAAKGGDPLAPVTVVVPSNFAALSVRRVLAAGGDGPGPTRGIANVTFATPYRLAELLGEQRVASTGRRPLTTPVLAAAVRRELTERPGYFAAAAAHHATEAALVALYGELGRARPETLARLETEGTGRSRAAVGAFRGVRARLAGYFDEDALVAAALDACRAADPALGRLGAVVVFLPDRLSPALGELLREVVERAPARVVVGLTGVPDADRTVVEQCGRLGWAVDADAVAPVHGTAVLSASDADEEVRATVRALLARAEQGVPLDRMGVLYPSSRPYARLVHEQLDAAGVPHNGPAVRTVADSAAARVLLRLLDLPEHGFRRDDVLALLGAGPLRVDGRAVPAARWDVLSRRAGVVGGPDDWATKLAAHAASRRADADALEAEGAGPGRIDGARRDADECDGLAAFVARLVVALEPAAVPPTWHGRAALATALARSMLGDAGERADWPEAEAGAADEVEAALARLAPLDAIDPEAPLAAFRRALEAELDAPMGRVGRFGEGVLTGPLALAAGLDLDVVLVLGLAEGSLPAPRRDDSLLPDGQRVLAVDGELALRSERVHEEHRAFLAGLAAGARERVVVHPRGDLRLGRGRLPSRWLLDTVSALDGRRVFSSDLPGLVDPRVEVRASFVDGLRRAGVDASPWERDLRLLLDAHDARLDVAAHPIAGLDGLAAGLEGQRARASSAFTRFDGNLAGRAVPSPSTGAVLSASRLESWAECPFRYFLSYVLQLRPVERPEDIVQIAPVDRGRLFHEVLERFLAPVVAAPRDARIAPGARWSAADHDRLHVLADEVFREYEARGVTGRRLLWQIEREALLEDLDSFLAADDAYRAAERVVPERVEMAFGADVGHPVEIAVPGGRTVAFRGLADRVDRSADGDLVVLDYKTGRPSARGTFDDDPVVAGTRLQLALYAEAARAVVGGGTTRAYYWHATAAGGFRRIGYELDEARRRRFVEVVAEIVDGIEAGCFPLVPGPESWPAGSFESCRFCDFDPVCPRERLGQSEAKAADPALAPYHALAEVAPADDAPAGDGPADDGPAGDAAAPAAGP